MSEATRQAIARIAKLKQMQEGGTEEEAKVAAKLAAEIMEKHGISESDVMIDDIERTYIPMERARHGHPVSYVAKAIADLCDCKFWCTIRNGESHIVFLGKEADRQVAEYLTLICKRAIASETEAFKKSVLYHHTPGRSQKTIATRSFQREMARRLKERIQELHRARMEKHHANQEHGLVLQKQGLVARKLHELGLKLKITRTKQMHDPFAGELGRKAGDSVGLYAGVKGGNNGAIRRLQ